MQNFYFSVDTVFYIVYNIIMIFRGVAQLVAREVWDFDAAGSNPVAPTNNTKIVRPLSAGGFGIIVDGFRIRTCNR